MQEVIGRTSIPARKSLRDFTFLYEMISGSLKIWRSNGWFCIRFHFFFFKTSFKEDTRLVLCHKRQYFIFPLSFVVFRIALPLCELYIWKKVFHQSLWVASVNQAFFEIGNIFLKRSFWGFFRTGFSLRIYHLWRMRLLPIHIWRPIIIT